VDPTNDDIVYVSGISQLSNNVPPFGMPPGSVPNSVGATSFHALMFRGDVTRARNLTGNVSDQWDHLTHATGNALMPNGGTAGTSAPHADSREMTFDASGDLIEVGDGGVTRRTSPDDNTGDWFSINGDIQVTEAHSVAYDTNFDIIIAGTQDTGAVEQTASGSTTWDSVRLADGGKVAVDDSTPGTSVRYLSSQRLGNFTRRTCNPGCANAFPALAGANNGQFYTPLEINTFDPSRLLLGTRNGLSESLDQGNTANIVPGAAVTASSSAAMVYGHPNNEELIYVGAVVGAVAQVFVRTTAGGNLAATATPFPGGGNVFGIAVDPEDEDVAYVIDDDQVFQTPDGGSTWTEITGNITVDGAGTFRSIEYIEGEPGNDKLVVGTNAGVMVSVEPRFNAWFVLGDDLPNAPVWDLDHDVTDDLLVAGTLGRGVWTLTDVSLITVPVITIPGSVTFADTCVAGTSTATLDVCNTGKADLLVETITSSDDSQFTVTQPSSGFPVLISPDFCFPFEVTFTPASTGPQSATLTITSNDPVTPSVEVTATGNGSEQELVTIIANGGDFGDVCPGEFRDLMLTLSNSGGCDLTVTDISSDSADFVTAGIGSLPLVIGPGDSVAVPIRFAPTSRGAKSGTITVDSDDPNSPSTVAVSGNGSEPDIAASIANTGNFGDVCIGELKDLDLTITNSGGCVLNVSSITSDSAEFEVAGVVSPPLVIGPGASVAVPIRFEPTSLGSKNALITVTSDDPDDGTITVAVSGNVPPGDIRVTGSTDFGDVCAEEQAEKTVAVCNVGPCNLNVSGASIDCPDFTLINNPIPAPVSPDSCLDLVVRFTPTSAGPKECILTITSDDPDTPVEQLTLTANTPLASIDVPPDQGFPPTVIQSVDACSSNEPFPVSNTGTCNLTITALSITDNGAEYSLFGLPSFPIILEPGHIAGAGALNTVFAPDVLDRARTGQVSVTYVSDPITGDTLTETRNLCGEGVRTGARVLVTQGGVPLSVVKSIKLQRLGPKKNKKLLDTIDNAMNLPLQTVPQTAPCASFQYHREYSTVSNAIQLAPGSYVVTVQARINGKNKKKTVGFDVSSCDFNPNIVVDF
jgi:hypothetical protein